MARIMDIKNVTLTTSFQEVTVASSLLFSRYIMNTQDDTDFEWKLLTADTETYISSLKANTSPVINDQARNYASHSTSLFFVKGVAGSELQIMFTRD
jgi:hypothetical protein